MTFKLCLQILIFFILVPLSARAWDQHHFFTRASLKGFQLKDPDIWQTLHQTVVVTPIEQFYTKAFGYLKNQSCNEKAIRNGVFEGLGKDYSVVYAEGSTYNLRLDWEKGLSYAFYKFLPSAKTANSQAIGESVKPIDVISIYSDEPDWAMDDDVERLRDLGTTKGIRGMGTRILRHFWFKGQKIVHVDMGEAQELDRRFELLFEMSMVAFQVGEPYWGFRFLGNSLHYLQDLAQPFHINSQISDDFIHLEKMRKAILCIAMSDKDRAERCTSSDTIDQAVIQSGWLNGTYHSIYEDFSRGIATSHIRAGESYLADINRAFTNYYNFPHLKFSLSANEKTKSYLRQIELIRSETTKYSVALSEALLDAFGKTYKSEPAHSHQELLRSGHEDSVGYRYAVLGFYDLPLSERQASGRSELVSLSNQLFLRVGSWTREYVSYALNYFSSQSPQELERLVRLYRSKCK